MTCLLYIQNIDDMLSDCYHKVKVIYPVVYNFIKIITTSWNHVNNFMKIKIKFVMNTIFGLFLLT